MDWYQVKVGHIYMYNYFYFYLNSIQCSAAIRTCHEMILRNQFFLVALFFFALKSSFLTYLLVLRL